MPSGGVIVFGIIFLLLGLFESVIGIALFVNPAVVSSELTRGGGLSDFLMLVNFLFVLGSATGFAMLASGMGMLAKKLWARNTAISLAIIGIVMWLARLSLNFYVIHEMNIPIRIGMMFPAIFAGLGFIFYGLVIWYLNTATVRVEFGIPNFDPKAPIRAEPAPRPLQMTEPVAPSQSVENETKRVREPMVSDAWLVEKEGARPGRQHGIKASGVTSIGRRGGNDIVIEDSTVSGQHAEIYKEDGRWQIQDLNSENGTIINGKEYIKHDLVENDLVLLGKTTLVFKNI